MTLSRSIFRTVSRKISSRSCRALRNLFVIARNSSFTYKGRAVDVKKVGSELGVSYVLEGSVRRFGTRVRITAQLIDAETGSHVWADRFDRDVVDVFAVQDEITLKIVGMLTRGLEDDALERAKRKAPESISAYEHWLRGKRLLWTYDRTNLEARRHFENAAQIDPTYSRAYSGLACTWLMEGLSFSNIDELQFSPYDRAMEFAGKALELDEADYQVHISIGLAASLRRRLWKDEARRNRPPRNHVESKRCRYACSLQLHAGHVR